MARESLRWKEVDDEEERLESTPSGFSIERLKTVIHSLVLIFVYLCLSIGLTFYQRALLKDFHFPLSVVICHLVLKFVLAGIWRFVSEWRTGRPRPQIPWKRYFTRFSPIGFTSGIDIGLSNWGLELITVSLYTITKSTSIIFILIFSLVFKLEKKSWSLVVIVLLIATGLTMFTYKATQFNTLGFLLVLLASFTSGVRWTLAQIVLQRSELGQQNPVDMVYNVQPWMILALLPFAAVFEGSQVASSCFLFAATSAKTAINTSISVGAGAFIAFAMEVSEYLVVVNTSSLTLSIAGVFKEVCTLVLAVLWNGDRMSLINVLGLVICLGGISSHVSHKVRSSNNASPIRSAPNVSSSEGPSRFEMNEPLLAYELQTSTEDDSDETDIFKVLSQRDQPPTR